MDFKLIKNEDEIKIMRENGRILAKIFSKLKSEIYVGKDLWELEELFIKLCREYNVNPSCKGYSPSYLSPFPTGLCISINEECVHCFPIKGKKLLDGDLITIDTIIEKKDLHIDSAFTQVVGSTTKEKDNILCIAKKALNEAIKKAGPGVKIGVISHTIQKITEKSGYNVIRDYAGHGIGYNLHEPPEIPCFGNKYQGMKLKPGMTICIEALISEGSPEIHHKSEWETEMKDKKLFVQFEHTILITESGREILTK